MTNNPEILIRFLPMIPDIALILAGIVIASIAVFAFFKRMRGWLWRIAALALFFLMLANPSLIEEIREIKPDTVLIVLDQSTSNQIQNRVIETEKIKTAIIDQLAAMPDVETRIITIGDSTADSGGTMMFEGIDRNSGDIPKSHLGAVIAISDGQIHDVPAMVESGKVPFHVLLTGQRGEHDRRLKIVRSPGFGLVGQQQAIVVNVEDDVTNEKYVNVAIRIDGNTTQTQSIPIGQDVEIPVTIQHAGANIFELSAAKGEKELSDENNHAVVTINGVRDRLRVLLISGDPHPGTRVWRNFLKSDPSVDLVHFTILRPPEKQDGVPTGELSLIAFPTKELFEEKLYDFNLIIFDRYRRLSVLPNEYMHNIVQFVEKGGALLDAEGPLPDGSLSLFDTPVGTILPSITSGKILDGEFVAKPSADGLRHPVIAGLPGLSKDGKQSKWGPWYRMTDAQLRKGNVLLEGNDGKPLLVLDRVGQGRVAQLFSDQIWLWARGHNGGGPHSELLRRLSHWLMKEPQLEENDLRAEANGRVISVTERSLSQSSKIVIVEKPGGESAQFPLIEESPGLSRTKITVDKTGLYRISNGEKSIMVGVGGLNPLEYSDLRSTKDKLKPVVDATGGSARWVSEDGIPNIRHLDANRRMSGQSWIGIRKNNNYSVSGIKQSPVIPPLAYLLLGVGFLLMAWRKEGR